MIVAVDGPSGSGKSSTARSVASRLGLRYLDTGAMYRAVTWAALTAGLDLDDRDAVAALARTTALEVGTDPAAPTVHVGGMDVTKAVREPRISAAVSRVATNLDVRELLVKRQQELIGSGGVVVEGRDITTVVAPDADVKILLTAEADTRMARRSAELAGSADPPDEDALRDQVLRRDRDDSTVARFLAPAPGAVVIDTTSHTLEEITDRIVDLAGGSR
ncbi:MAG: (d)CMP kinase [Propionibacteriales bacterium]|nr:(d)CMP kinase [Propionibacteriales bacterium]